MMAPQLAAAMKQNGMGLPSSDTPQHGGNAFEMLTARHVAQQQAAAQASTMQMGGAPMPMGHMAPLQHMQHLRQQQQQHAFAAGGAYYGCAQGGRRSATRRWAPPPRAGGGGAASLRAPSAAKCSRRRPT